MKTTESSLEKHTVIEGGNVLTTVHETERVDGEIVKDDIVQVKSDVDEGTPTEGKSFLLIRKFNLFGQLCEPACCPSLAEILLISTFVFTISVTA